ncbi:transcriptional regulator [Paenibacillus sp. FSL R7-0273]|uniref:LysR family transcriptional regulator n=1 Tax=Paenibacillus sp. FSL R7-0273 TaxID=1536772 RepID=UPI0004F6E347|nr:LysR family transcriptional regulator [Paenibacillus sp. FSL R7-0273]AIQ46700.1 transcriptional regulator [Paenibacillus sp. FSL R7-0273]OMF97531.1 transcriptional regulator [Paenibacillus sp. FSL R7-0273]
MESQDLRIFKQVAELQSVSKAAEKLGYVQSNISQRIKGLEEELGVRLFLRNNRGVTLTKEGSELLGYANQILLLMEEARSSVNPVKWKKSLAIGAPQTVAAIRIPRLLSSFLQNHNIDIKLRTNSAERLQEMLSYGELDGIFVNGPYNNVLFESVYTYDERLVILSPKQNPGKPLHMQTLIVNSDPECVYRRKLLGLFSQKEQPDRSVLEFDSLESILQAVNEGLGISILPAEVADSRKELHSVRFEELPDKMTIRFVIRRRKQQPPALHRFIRFLELAHLEA